MIPRKTLNLFSLLFVLGIGLALAACSASSTATPAPVAPTKFAVPTPMLPPPTEKPPVEPSPIPEPTTELVAEPTELPAADQPTEEAPAAAAGGSDTCIACHTSQETLVALAEEKEVKSEATSGEG